MKCQNLLALKGTLSGLETEGLVLETSLKNGTSGAETSERTLTANGPFTISTTLLAGTTYALAIKTPPPKKTCTLAPSSGTFANSDVSVAVTCVDTPNLRFFATFNSYNGDLGGIAGADAKCNDTTDANRPTDTGTPATYKAFLWADTSAPETSRNPNASIGNGVLKAGRTYVQSTGTPAAIIGETSAEGVLPLPAGVSFVTTLSYAWIGRNSSWTAGADCNGWTTSDSNQTGTRISAGSQTSPMADTTTCNMARNILCVEQ